MTSSSATAAARRQFDQAMAVLEVDRDAAHRHFREATDADPSMADAWLGRVAVGDDEAGFGEVEQFHGFGNEPADDRQVDAAFAGEGGIADGIGAAAERGIADGGDGGGARRLGVEDAADGQHGVADGLGFEAAGGGSPEERVVGVEVGRLRGGGRGELVGAAEDDLAEQFLEGTAGRLELEREVVEVYGNGAPALAESPLTALAERDAEVAAAEQTAATSKATQSSMPSRNCTRVAAAGKVWSGVAVASTIRSIVPVTE